MSWKINKSKELYRNKWMWVTEDEVETESGYKLTWGVVHKNPAVLVIPKVGEYTYLVGQYRYPVDLYSWEFVQGHFEHDSVEDTANHELEEEVGLKAGKLELIGKFYLAPGHHTQEYYVFVATDISDGTKNPEPDEMSMETKKVTFKEVENMISNGEIKDGPTLAGFSIFNAWKNKHE